MIFSLVIKQVLKTISLMNKQLIYQIVYCLLAMTIASHVGAQTKRQELDPGKRIVEQLFPDYQNVKAGLAKPLVLESAPERDIRSKQALMESIFQNYRPGNTGTVQAKNQAVLRTTETAAQKLPSETAVEETAKQEEKPAQPAPSPMAQEASGKEQ